MKKFFTLTMLLVMALTVNAQDVTYRKSWDFTKWSPTTVANLQAEAAKGASAGAWSDLEKADGSAVTNDIAKDNCFWQVTASGADGITLTANDEVISELDGLTFNNTSARSLAIAVNYGDCSSANGAGFGPYHGSSYLWLGSNKKTYFMIPHVAPGTTIKMGIESHKLTDARGVELYVGKGTSGTKLLDPNGVTVAIPTEYQDLEWLVPEDLTDTPNEDGTFDIQVYNTNGCHVYYITVGDGDQPTVEEAKKVAYLYNGDLESDWAHIFLAGMTDKIELTDIAMETSPTLETLSDYEAVVIAPSVEDASSLKDLIAFIPVVNLTASNYATLGKGGINRLTDTSIMTITDTENAIFEGFEEAIEYNDVINGVLLDGYFANDAVLAKAGDVTAIHTHNPGRNAYYLVPAENASDDVYITLIPNTVLAAAKTKRDVTAVGTPNISIKQEDGQSVVTITAANSTAIYYTLNEAEPTIESTLYTEPFTVTEACTVKAFAIGDGYTDSQVAEKAVTIATKAAAPVFTLSRENGKTTVTLTSATEGVDIYYNFAGQSTTTASVKYSVPFEVTTPCTVTAFANAAEGILASDVVEQFIGVDGINKDNIRWDVVAHFNANADNWSGKGQQTDESGAIINANYFFTWGKNAGTYWDETSEKVQKVDEDGDLVYDEEGNPVMVYTKTLAPETYEADGWLLKSIGQVMTWEKLNLGWNIGDTSMRNPDTAEDVIGVNDEEGITENALTFGKQPSDGPFNASLETTAKIAGPFDVVLYAGNGNDGETPTMQIETSTDGENWTKLGDVAFSLIKRNWKKTVLSFEENSEVYVRLLHTAAKSSAQIYDIYVMNNGEKSKQYSEETMGVSEVKADQRSKVAGIYSINGVRLQQLQRGLNIVVGADGKVRKVMVK